MTQALRRVRNDQHMTLNFEGLQQRIIRVDDEGGQ